MTKRRRNSTVAQIVTILRSNYPAHDAKHARRVAVWRSPSSSREPFGCS